MTLKKEIEAMAVKTIRCPSCGADPDKPCRKRVALSPYAWHYSRCPTHQRRLSAFVAQNIREEATGAKT